MSEFSEARAIAQDFYTNAIDQLNQQIIGEDAAKRGVVLSLVNGENLVFAGKPGGGKTELAHDAWRLVDGIDEDNLARVPHSADLTSKRLIGGSVVTSEDIEINGEVRTQRKTTQIEPIIKPEVQAIFFDEISRINPAALNEALDVAEAKSYVNDSGLVVLRGLMHVAATMNPSENRQATFPMTDALASRFAVGAVLGHKGNEAERDEMLDSILGAKSKPTIDAVVKLNDLELVRGARLALPETLKPEAKKLIVKSVDGLADHDIHEEYARFARQVRSNAEGLSLMDGEGAISEKALAEAARYAVAARIAIKGSSQIRRGQGLNDAIDQIISG